MRREEFELGADDGRGIRRRTVEALGGFQPPAVSPDQSRLWLLLQSPLEHPVPKAAKTSGNVRLLALINQ